MPVFFTDHLKCPKKAIYIPTIVLVAVESRVATVLQEILPLTSDW